MSNEWFIIANGLSNSGKTVSFLERVIKKLQDEKIQYNLNLTAKSGDEINLVKKAASIGCNKILAIGGDGTVQKVVAGIILQKSISLEKMTFALIPSGTGNDWAKSKNISSNLTRCIRVLKSGKINTQDVGVAIITANNKKKIRYFVTYSGLGFDSFMLSRIDKYKWLGKLSYLVCAIMNFVKFQNIAVKVVTSKTEIETSVFLLGVGICKFTGGGMQLIKNPAGNNGLLNITIAQEFSKFDIIRNFFNLFNGSIFKERKVLTLVDDVVKISAKKGDLVCQGDGEIFGAGKIEYSIIKKGLRYLS
jgi:YegS/Rv2252/BmrU family lipid kinase